MEGGHFFQCFCGESGKLVDTPAVGVDARSDDKPVEQEFYEVWETAPEGPKLLAAQSKQLPKKPGKPLPLPPPKRR